MARRTRVAWRPPRYRKPPLGPRLGSERDCVETRVRDLSIASESLAAGARQLLHPVSSRRPDSPGPLDPRLRFVRRPRHARDTYLRSIGVDRSREREREKEQRSGRSIAPSWPVRLAPRCRFWRATLNMGMEATSIPRREYRRLV